MGERKAFGEVDVCGGRDEGTKMTHVPPTRQRSVITPTQQYPRLFNGDYFFIYPLKNATYFRGVVCDGRQVRHLPSTVKAGLEVDKTDGPD